MTAIGLGDKVRDTITGLTGIVIARHEYLNGCVRLTVQPQELKDGKPVEGTTLDIQQLELAEANTPAAQPKLAAVGGPHDEPSRPSAPTR